MPLSRPTLQTILEQVDHRPWPLPSLPWVMSQTWEKLAFMHWPLPASSLRPRVPRALDIDTWEGDAWVGVVPFDVADQSLRGRVPVPLASRFVEVNLRTYVRHRGHSGVYFFSLDADNVLAVIGARLLYGLPYYRARMRIDEGTDGIGFTSARRHPLATEAHFMARYTPWGDPLPYQPASFERWLTERYCLFTVDRWGLCWRADIHHQPWPLRVARADVQACTLAAASGLDLPDCPPIVHYADRLDVLIWPPVPSR